MPDQPQQSQQPKSAPAADKAADKNLTGPSVSQDPSVPNVYADLDPTKVVGDYAEQPDPNSGRPAPLPNVPEGVNKAPADDDKDAGSIGEHGGYGPDGDPVQNAADKK